MKIRRCAVVFLEPREDVAFELESLLAGGDGLRRERRWLALAPHIGEEVELDGTERELLGQLSPGQWIEADGLDVDLAPALPRLLTEGLVVADSDGDAVRAGWRERDARFREVHWHPLGATLHAFTRWEGVDAVQNSKDSRTETAVEMRQVLGAPPVEAATRTEDDSRVALPRVAPNDFDRLLARRATCRNFDPSRLLPFEAFARVMQRVFAAQAEVRVSEDTVFLKKNVPSGGGLHPMECYLVVQHVEGVAPGLYHYHATDHALEPLPFRATDAAGGSEDAIDGRDGDEAIAAEPAALRRFVMDMVAQQHWFADAHVVVLLSPRFDRTFWKYRQHAKGYRVVALEGGHLSQTLYLSATEAGLGAFITGAINEKQLERAFGLDPVSQGALAICGFGWRGPVMETAELDPAGEVWAPAAP